MCCGGSVAYYVPPDWHGHVLSPPPSVAPERVLVCLPRFWGPCVCRATHLHRCCGCNSLTQRCLERSVRTVVSPEGTSCKGIAVQSHPRPLLFSPATCTSGRVKKMWERGREQNDTPWYHWLWFDEYRFLSDDESYEIWLVRIRVVNPIFRDIGVLSADESYILRVVSLQVVNPVSYRFLCERDACVSHIYTRHVCDTQIQRNVTHVIETCMCHTSYETCVCHTCKRDVCLSHI